MARKDQIKLFFCACIADEPLIPMLKETRPSIKAWSYMRAIRHWRDKVNTLVKAGLSEPDKHVQIALNKAVDVFKKIPEQDVEIVMYLNFCLSLGEDIMTNVRNKKEKKLWEKIIENMFKLYMLFDPDIKDEVNMERAIKMNEIVWKVF